MAQDNARSLKGKVLEVSISQTKNGRDMAAVKIADAAGEINTWRAWGKQAASLKIGGWYQFEVSTPPQDKGGGVWHNLDKIGAPVPQPKGAVKAEDNGGPAGNGGARGKSDHQVIIERRSFERQGSVGKVIQLMELGYSLDELAGDVLDKVLAAAAKIEAHYSRRVDADPVVASGWADIAQAQAQDPVPSEPAVDLEAPPADEPEADAPEPEQPGANGTAPAGPFANVGELLTQLLQEHPDRTAGDLCQLLGVKAPREIGDLPAAYAVATEAWADDTG